MTIKYIKLNKIGTIMSVLVVSKRLIHHNKDWNSDILKLALKACESKRLIHHNKDWNIHSAIDFEYTAFV